MLVLAEAGMSRETHQYRPAFVARPPRRQVVTKNVVKLEFVLGLANLMQDTLGSGQQPQMLQMTAEILVPAKAGTCAREGG